MIILAAVLTLGIQYDVDLTSIAIRYDRRKVTGLTCGIKVVGYRFNGQPGQQVKYAGETFTIPRAGFIEVISLPRVKTFVVDGETRPLEDGVSPLDGFSFRWIDLAVKTAKGAEGK